MLKKIYPDLDELVVYSMTASLLLTVVLAGELRLALSNVTSHLALVVVSAWQSDGWEGLKLGAGFGLLGLAIFANLFAGLYLPFTQRRLDGLVLGIVFIHGTLICIGNFIAQKESASAFPKIIFLVSIIWFLTLIFGVRLKLIVVRTTTRQTTAKEAMIATLLLSVVLASSSFIFNLHWAHSYTLAVVAASTFTQFIVDQRGAGQGLEW